MYLNTDQTIYFYFCDYVDQEDINIFPEKGGDTSLRITILDEKKTDRQVMQTLVLLIPHFTFALPCGGESLKANLQCVAAN